MATRFRPISKPAASLLQSFTRRTRTMPNPAAPPARLHPTFSRVRRETAHLESMLPLHSAVSSARLTSRLGVDSAGVSRSLSQESGLSVPR